MNKLVDASLNNRFVVLLGALHGTDAFPDRWRGDNLEDHDGLVELADQLYDLRWPESG